LRTSIKDMRQSAHGEIYSNALRADVVQRGSNDDLNTAFSMDYEIDLKNKAVNDLEFKDYANAVQDALK